VFEFLRKGSRQAEKDPAAFLLIFYFQKEERVEVW
jgi:hypothetical protein